MKYKILHKWYKKDNDDRFALLFGKIAFRPAKANDKQFWDNLHRWVQLFLKEIESPEVGH